MRKTEQAPLMVVAAAVGRWFREQVKNCTDEPRLHTDGTPMDIHGAPHIFEGDFGILLKYEEWRNSRVMLPQCEPNDEKREEPP